MFKKQNCYDKTFVVCIYNFLIKYLKGKLPGVLFHGITSQYSLCKEIWIFVPIQQGTEKTWSCFALDTEHQYWAVTVQYLCRVKKISMTSNVLPLYFARSQASSCQSSNVRIFASYLFSQFLRAGTGCFGTFFGTLFLL